MRVLPTSRAARLLAIGALTALAQGLLTHAVQASLFRCSGQPCPLLGTYQTVLSLLDFPAAQLALLPQLEALSQAPAVAWLVLDALVWGAIAMLIAWRLPSRAPH
ncbi:MULTISPECIES: hypothetical protein [unclassified Pseudomonas]|uniref:hypothetical protein n=1 Tax=unclassified Pseudomonas TaxID=196821 RepID=UPI0012F73AF8|nr:hypothetical protein [Pseudomonas sp. M47T1]